MSASKTTRSSGPLMKPATIGLAARPMSDAVIISPKPVACASAGSSAPPEV